MKKIIFTILFFLTGCYSLPNYQPQESYPDYNRLASHVNIVEKSSSHVIYEYSDVRIDEVSGIAAIYCYDKTGKKQASLHKIITRPDNRRHATFICQ